MSTRKSITAAQLDEAERRLEMNARCNCGHPWVQHPADRSRIEVSYPCRVCECRMWSVEPC